MNHYQILQVSPAATQEVVEAAYKALMKKYHPDMGYSKGRRAVALNAAYQVLSSPVERRKYDQSLATPPDTIGDYRIIKPLAEGGFGKTYLAEHTVLGNRVCVKHCNHISPTDTEILRQEAQAMWDLRHHGLPAVRDFKILDDDSAVLVMSYIPGPTLEEVVTAHRKRRKHVDPEHVAWITERIFNILSYLHRQGVVHGDIKPQNIIIQPQSHTVVLIDFGLAAVKPHRGDRAKGFTEVFAPPEQTRGQVLIPEADFYSLATTMLFTLNTGEIGPTVARSVPVGVPDPMCQFFQQFLKHNPLQRPNWSKTDLIADCIAMRKQSFGRSRSMMKPLVL